VAEKVEMSYKRWAKDIKVNHTIEKNLQVMKFSKSGFYLVFLQAMNDDDAVIRSLPNTLIVE